jgi:hypothetical protein
MKTITIAGIIKGKLKEVTVRFNEDDVDYEDVKRKAFSVLEKEGLSKNNAFLIDWEEFILEPYV